MQLWSQRIIPLVPQFWAEISEHITLMYVYNLSILPVPTLTLTFSYRESLYESDLPKPLRDSAALLASKVYYYLGEYDEALTLALGAGPAFEAESRVPGSE